ncbi:hypothetical protein F53441_5481 [Fusarium austroafricanum]|uniref:Uncharacterized protein n=1 Tax=Fusarium austroafricanum TaxID=2364996 RepID=A0A8H4KK67_9HYPO|nr:hypothetical protein F53441_5481 [Fusarium austroafricanum]
MAMSIGSESGSEMGRRASFDPCQHMSDDAPLELSHGSETNVDPKLLAFESDANQQSCACLASLYLSLEEVRKADDLPFTARLSVLRHLTTSAATIIQCTVCPTKFLWAMQNAQLLNTLIISLAEGYKKIVKSVEEETKRAQDAKESKQLYIAEGQKLETPPANDSPTIIIIIISIIVIVIVILIMQSGHYSQGTIPHPGVAPPPPPRPPPPFILMAAEWPQVPLQHRQILFQAVRKVLMSQIGQVTFAEIFRQVPLVRTMLDMDCDLHGLHDWNVENWASPISNELATYTKGRLMRLQGDDLKVGTRVLEEYRKTTVGQLAFKYRLLDAVSSCILWTANDLYTLYKDQPKNDRWRDDRDEIGVLYRSHPLGRPTNLFRYSQPRHVETSSAEAGLWAVSRIFSGIPRVDEDTWRLIEEAEMLGITELDFPGITILCQRACRGNENYQLLPGDWSALVQFLYQEQLQPRDPFPICKHSGLTTVGNNLPQDWIDNL